jgi:hypothetical protein
VQRRELPAPRVSIGADVQRASTQLGYAGAYSVTLSTTLPELALELHSTYLGHAQTPTSTAHLVLAPEVHELRQLVHDAGALPVAGGPNTRPGAHGRGALLLDHLGELQAAIGRYLATTERGDSEVRVDVDDEALRVLEDA